MNHKEINQQDKLRSQAIHKKQTEKAMRLVKSRLTTEQMAELNEFELEFNKRNGMTADQKIESELKYRKLTNAVLKQYKKSIQIAKYGKDNRSKALTKGGLAKQRGVIIMDSEIVL